MDIFIPSLIRPFNPNEHQDLLAIPRCLIPDNKKINIDYKVDVKKLVDMTGTNPPTSICCTQEFKENIKTLENEIHTLKNAVAGCLWEKEKSQHDDLKKITDKLQSQITCLQLNLNMELDHERKMEGDMESFKKGINGRLDNHLCMFDEIHEKINELVRTRIDHQLKFINDLKESVGKMDQRLDDHADLFVRDITLITKLEDHIKGLDKRIDVCNAVVKTQDDEIHELQKDLKNTQKIFESRLSSIETSIIPPPCPHHQRKKELYEKFIDIMKTTNSCGWFCPNCECMAFGGNNMIGGHTCNPVN